MQNCYGVFVTFGRIDLFGKVIYNYVLNGFTREYLQEIRMKIGIRTQVCVCVLKSLILYFVFNLGFP